MSKPSSHGENLVLTAKEAHSLIALSRSSSLLSLLKHPDFAMVAAIAFAGFRVDSNGLSNPIVRRRLADEAVRNAEFAEKLRETAQPQPAPSSPHPSAVIPTRQAPRSAAAIAPDAVAEKYKAERDRLKRELAEEAERRRVAERELGQAKIEALSASATKTDSEREALRYKQRAERLERKLRRLEIENAQLRRVIGTTPQASPGFESQQAAMPDKGGKGAASATEPGRTDQAFANAVRRLLDRKKWLEAREITENVLRADSFNEAALAIHAHASEEMGDLRAGLQDLRSLVTAQVGRGDIVASARTLTQLITKSPAPASESKAMKEFYTAIAGWSGDKTEVREIFVALRQQLPEVFATLREAAYGDAITLFSARVSDRVSADAPLPIALAAGLPRSVTGRSIVSWLDRNDGAAIVSVREAVSHLTDDSLTHLANAIAAASDGDPTYYRLVIRRNLTGPVVVDASNAAWHGQEMAATPRPRLRQVIALRQALRDRGYFPILLIADANLPYVVDDTVQARKMIAEGQLLLATSGTDADEYILREARRLRAPVVSNDYMVEWDPGQDVTKLQYSIAPTSGVVSIYE